MASPLIIDPVTKCAHTSALLPDQNYGNADPMWCCNYDFFGTKYACLGYFGADISAIPAGATILATSKLELNVTTIYQGDVPGHVMWFAWGLAAWAEDTITKNNPPGHEGGVFSISGATATGLWTMTGANLAAALQSCLDDRGGIWDGYLYPGVLATQEGGFQCNSDDAAANKPKLTVDYTVGRRWGEVPSSELVPNDFGDDDRRFGAVPSDESVAEDFGADERRFGAVPTDESVPTDLT